MCEVMLNIKGQTQSRTHLLIKAAGRLQGPRVIWVFTNKIKCCLASVSSLATSGPVTETQDVLGSGQEGDMVP